MTALSPDDAFWRRPLTVRPGNTASAARKLMPLDDVPLRSGA